MIEELLAPLPVRFVRHDELLAILTSLRFTLKRADRGGDSDYSTGFADGLKAVAMSARLGD